jgi:hypothetical protein
LWVCLFCCCCNWIFASWAVAEDRNIGTWRLYWPTASWERERERWQFRVFGGLLVIILWPFSCKCQNLKFHPQYPHSIFFWNFKLVPRGINMYKVYNFRTMVWVSSWYWNVWYQRST